MQLARTGHGGCRGHLRYSRSLASSGTSEGPPGDELQAAISVPALCRQRLAIAINTVELRDEGTVTASLGGVRMDVSPQHESVSLRERLLMWRISCTSVRTSRMP